MTSTSAPTASESEKTVEINIDGTLYRLILPNADRDYIQKKIAAERAPYEADLLSDMRIFLKPGDLVLDVGANVGNHSIYLAAVSKAKVLAFEPNESLCQAIHKSAQASGVSDRVTVRSTAMGRVSGSGAFKAILPDNLGAQQIVQGAGDIPIETIDSISFDQPVRILKIDVEGMEMDVLLGAEGTIKSHRPRIYVECKSESEFRRVSAYLNGLEYALWDTFSATPTHLFRPLEGIDSAERLAHIHDKLAIESYRTSTQLAGLQGRFNDANLKYRTAQENITALKTRLVTEESGRKAAEQSAHDLRAQIEQLQSRVLTASPVQDEGATQRLVHTVTTAMASVLNAQQPQDEQHRATLLSQVAKLHGQNAALKDESTENRAELDRRRRDILALEEQLRDESARTAGWKARIEVLSEARASADVSFAESKAELAAFRAQVDTLRMDRVAAQRDLEAARSANQGLLSSVETERTRNASLQSRCETLADSLRAVESELGKTQISEAGLRNALAAAATVRNEQERRIVELAADISDLQHRLNLQIEGRKDDQQRAEEISEVLRHSLTEAESVGRTHKVRIDELTGNLAELTSEINVERSGREGERHESRQSLEVLRNALAAAEVGRAQGAQLIRELEARNSALQSDLELVRRESQLLVEQLRASLAMAEIVRSEHAIRIHHLESEVSAGGLERERLAAELGGIVAQGERDVAAFATENNRQREAIALGELAINRETARADRLAVEVVGLNERLLALLDGQTHPSGIDAVAALGSQLSEVRQALTERQRELDDTKAVLRVAEGELRDLRVQQGSLDRQSEQAQQELVQHRATIERLRQQMIELSRASLVTTSKNHDLSARVFVAEKQALKAKATISFQLGHALLEAKKSWKGVFQLPSVMWRLRGEAARRRASGKQSIPKTDQSVKKPDHIPKKPEASEAIPAPKSIPVPALSTQLPPMPTRQVSRPLDTLRVAAIMDEFTAACFAPACQLTHLTPSGWKEEIDTARPELLFVESAWRGKDDLWGNRIGHRAQELVALVEDCRARGIPTVFWNKEDPVHFETFLNTVKLFDYVFTTDLDCIHRYKAILGHERVYLLPFACQPAIHNPIENQPRKDAFCFAGAYYVKYPDRTRDLNDFILTLPQFRPMEIYDRNFGKNDPNYQFPPAFKPYIVGTLPFGEIDKAYKGYRFAVNLNSIKQSQTMFARRVFELLACNTTTISNFSRGVRLLFGDLVITSDSGDEVVRRLRVLDGNALHLRKHRLLGLRKVMSEHTYQDRLAQIADAVGIIPRASQLSKIVVVCYAKDGIRARSLVASFEAQNHVEKRMVLIVPNGLDVSSGNPAIKVTSRSETDHLLLADLADESEWVSAMVADDYYGSNYLTDLVLATRYSEATVIGKAAYFLQNSKVSKPRLMEDGRQYVYVESIPARSAIAIRSVVSSLSVKDWIGTAYRLELKSEKVLSIDEFNYCRNVTAVPQDQRNDAIDCCSDPSFNVGVGLPALTSVAQVACVTSKSESGLRFLSGVEILGLLPKSNEVVRFGPQGTGFEIVSQLPDGKHQYFYCKKEFSAEDLLISRFSVRLHLEATPGLNVQLSVIFLAKDRSRLGHSNLVSNKNNELSVPAETAFIQIGLRVYGSGSSVISRLYLENKDLEPPCIMSTSAALVITNNYPSYDDLYRNAFVHKRVSRYNDEGIATEVFRFKADTQISYHEFEDQDCITGSVGALKKAIARNAHRVLLVHFLNEEIWDSLIACNALARAVVWIHGADIQGPARRPWGIDDVAAKQAEYVSGRGAFWKRVLASDSGIKFVFVSEYLRRSAEEDLGIRLKSANHYTIPNGIDTGLFVYSEKRAEQRYKILSIRPYASLVYANDLMARAVLELSKHPVFGKLQITIVGEGPLFDEVTEPLRKFSNIELRRGFLTQREISGLHKENGIFLCPSRMDTQGVSRDEAMSSGLIPITNSVAAIPEFVDAESAILAAPEDASQLAEGIIRIVSDPALFLRMSNKAAETIRRNRSEDIITPRELGLFK